MLRNLFMFHFVLLLPGLLACGMSGSHGAAQKSALPVASAPQHPQSLPPLPPGPARLIIGATLMTAAGERVEAGYLWMKDGRIAALGSGDPPADLRRLAGATAVIDVTGQGKFITPGIIDTHSHMGVYPFPEVKAHSDGNEMVRPATPEVWAEHAFWPQDPNIPRAVASGVTTVQILPGSGNLIGGRSFVAKLRRATSARQMRFPGAPQGLKMACGENPKRIYGDKGGPMTRMGNVAGHRSWFQRAWEYRRQGQIYQRDLAHWREHSGENNDHGDPPEPPTRDLALETLVKVLQGEILVHTHCYRADDIHIILDVAEEFGFKIRSFHHGLEAYKLADRLATAQVSVSTWADWWGFKLEAFDGIPHNAALLSHAGARAIIHSDSPSELRHLNHEAVKARAAGQTLDIDISENETLRWITANPAWALGIDDQVGTLEVGKMADVVLWDAHPFSVYAKTDLVFIDGALVFDRKAGRRSSDFELGLSGGAGS